MKSSSLPTWGPSLPEETLIYCRLVIVGWLVGCFGFNGPLRQYFSLYQAVSQREGERGERIDESKNVQTTPTRTYCKCSKPLPYFNPNRRMPRHWKFTQYHRTTRPPPLIIVKHSVTERCHKESYQMELL